MQSAANEPTLHRPARRTIRHLANTTLTIVMPEIVFKGKEYVYNHHLTVPYHP